MSFSQNREEEVILKYFGSHIGTFLSVGENDGETLSNVRQLAINGWRGVCVEPCPEPFEKLEKLYDYYDSYLNGEAIDNYDAVLIINIAIGTETGYADFYKSGEHLGKGDSGLLSTLVPSEMDRWKGTEVFEKIMVPVISWSDFYENLCNPTFDFVSIDIEGKDVDVLEQMDLDAMETKMVCIEHNSNRKTLKRIKAKLKGWKELHRNHENIIMTR